MVVMDTFDIIYLTVLVAAILVEIIILIIQKVLRAKTDLLIAKLEHDQYEKKKGVNYEIY